MIIRLFLLLLVLCPGIMNEAMGLSVSDSIRISNQYHLLEKKNHALPEYDLFFKGMKGYYKFSEDSLIENPMLTLIDFRLESVKRRMWVIDLLHSRVLFHTLVSHGKNTGKNKAIQFSNNPRSHQSSIGFYITGQTYQGKHGISLYLDGQEKQFNSHARKRAIVMHGAKYVSKDFIRQYGRLGRSFGCPAVPVEQHREIIQQIKGKSCLFIYFPDPFYLKTSGIIGQPSH